MALQASEDGALWSEGLLLPDALSGSLQLTASTGQLAAVLPLTGDLLARAAPKATPDDSDRDGGTPSGPPVPAHLSLPTHHGAALLPSTRGDARGASLGLDVGEDTSRSCAILQGVISQRR